MKKFLTDDLKKSKQYYDVEVSVKKDNASMNYVKLFATIEEVNAFCDVDCDQAINQYKTIVGKSFFTDIEIIYTIYNMRFYLQYLKDQYSK